MIIGWCRPGRGGPGLRLAGPRVPDHAAAAPWHGRTAAGTQARRIYRWAPFKLAAGYSPGLRVRLRRAESARRRRVTVTAFKSRFARQPERRPLGPSPTGRGNPGREAWRLASAPPPVHRRGAAWPCGPSGPRLARAAPARHWHQSPPGPGLSAPCPGRRSAALGHGPSHPVAPPGRSRSLTVTEAASLSAAPACRATGPCQWVTGPRHPVAPRRSARQVCGRRVLRRSPGGRAGPAAARRLAESVCLITVTEAWPAGWRLRLVTARRPCG
jgi:hypothetical protein